MPAAWRAQGAGQHACAGIPLHDACGEKRTQTSATGTDAGRTLSSVLHAQARVGRRTTMKSCRFFDSMAAIGVALRLPYTKFYSTYFFVFSFGWPDTVFPGKRGGKGRMEPSEHAVHSGRRWAKKCGVAVASLSAAAALALASLLGGGQDVRWAGAGDKARLGALLLGREQAAALKGVALSARAHRAIVDRVHGKRRRRDSVAGVSIDKVALESPAPPCSRAHANSRMAASCVLAH